MKLKWRIFLISLAFIMIAVAASALFVLQINFTSSVKAERESAAAYHSYFSSSVSSRLIYMRMTGSVAVLDEDRTQSTLSDIALDYGAFGEAEALIIADAGGKVIGSGGDSPLVDYSKLPSFSKLEKSTCTTYIYDSGDMTVLLAASPFSIEGMDLYILSAHDITDTYSTFDGLFRFTGALSIAFALIISLILFIFTAMILRPVSTLNSSLGRIADGDYTSRVREKGTTELSEIAKNINIMAEAVEEKVDRLENIAEGRKHYVDSLAHEMKTPLTSILCYGDLLRIKRDVSSEERLEYSGVIVEEAKRLKNLSSKLLELACADSAELEFTTLVISELFADIEEILAPAFEKTGVSLLVGQSDGVINADKELFLSLLLNLCDNAAKASKEGDTVELRSTSYKNSVIIEVCDTGIGMSPEVLKKVTEPFYMADKSRSRKAGGAGLGLSLCSEISRRHGAKMEIKSELGKGTTVSVTVPSAKGGSNENN